MGGVDTGLSSKDEEPTLRRAHNIIRGHRPDIQLFRHPEQTANTTFRDRHPDVPPLALEPRRRMTRPPTAQAAQGKPLADHGRRTNIRDRRPGLKDNHCCRCPSSPGNLAVNTTFRDRHPDVAPLALELDTA